MQLVAPRGTISDRNRIPLVENRPSFNMLLYREAMKDQDATVEFLTTRLGIDAETIEAQLRRSKSAGLYRPILIKEDADMEAIAIVEAHRRIILKSRSALNHDASIITAGLPLTCWDMSARSRSRTWQQTISRAPPRGRWSDGPG